MLLLLNIWWRVKDSNLLDQAYETLQLPSLPTILPFVGLEPTTPGLQNQRSTIKLKGLYGTNGI